MSLVIPNSRQRRRFKAPAIGEFYRSRSKRRIGPNEELSETEDEVSEDWLIVKHEEVPSKDINFIAHIVDSRRFYRLHFTRNPLHETLGPLRQSR